MPVATYSLLEKHEDVITYRIPDPADRTHAYVELGLYSWELEGASAGEVMQAALEGREPTDETFDGIGLRIDYQPPTRYHPTPREPNARLTDQLETFSHGSGQNGDTYRVESATAGDLREAARRAAQYVFCYWWALDHHDDFTPGVTRNESYSERRQRLSIIEQVHEDGTIVQTDGTVVETPYSLDACALVPAADWPTPEERCASAFDSLIDDLLAEYPEFAVQQGYRDADSDRICTPPTETEARKQAREYERALAAVTAEADGVGRTLRRALKREFESMADLCADLRAGGDRLHDMHHLGASIEDALVDALLATDNWVPDSDEGDE